MTLKHPRVFAGVGIAAIVLAIVVVSARTGRQDVVEASQVPGAPAAELAEPAAFFAEPLVQDAAPALAEEPAVVAPNPLAVNKIAKPLTYEEAVGIYQASGFRFQFSNCNGTPGELNIKRGTSLMLDNRDERDHVIAVGSKSYNVKGYGFAIATASEVGRLSVTCDKGGAAMLTVQP